MGQGLYDLLGWGVLEPPYRVDEEDCLIDFANLDGAIRTASETEPLYLVVPLAVSDDWLQDWWRLPPMPDWVPRVAARRARYLRRPRSYAIPVAAHQAWQAAQRVYRGHGLRLPPARLILLNDWH